MEIWSISCIWHCIQYEKLCYIELRYDEIQWCITNRVMFLGQRIMLKWDYRETVHINEISSLGEQISSTFFNIDDF